MKPAFSRHVWTKIGIWAAGLVILVGILGFLVLPPVLKSALTKELGAKLHREVSVGSISFNPYTLTLVVRDFAIKENSGPGRLFAFDELYVDAELMSVVRLAPVVKELRLAGPRVSLARTAPGRYSVSDLIEEFMAKPGDGPTPRFALNNIQVSGGRIDFDDQPEHVKHQVSDITLGIPFISSIPSQTDIFVEPRLAAKINGAPFALAGKSKPFRESLETEVGIDIDQLDLAALAEYIPSDIRIKVPSGRFGSRLAVKFLRHPDKGATLKISGSASLADFVMTDQAGKPLLKLPKVALDLADFEPLARSAKVSRLSFDAPQISARRDKSGKINWLALLPAAKPAAPAPDAAPSKPFNVELAELAVTKAKLAFDDDMPATPWRAGIDALDVALTGYSSTTAAPLLLSAAIRGAQVAKTGSKDDVLRLPQLDIKGASIDLSKRELVLGEVSGSGARLALNRDKDGRLDLEAMLAAEPAGTAPAAGASPAPPWVVTVGKLALDGYGIALRDETTRRGASITLEPISLAAQDLSTRQDAKGRVELKATLNKKGSINLAGPLTLQPLSGDTSIDLRGIEILPFQPYFASRLNISVTSGEVSLKGASKWRLGGPGQAPVSGDFSGMLDVSDFASVERRSAEDFLKWKSLHVGTVRGALDPLNFEIDEIALSEFYSRLIVLPEGRLNVQDIVRKPGDDAIPAPAAAPASTSTNVAGATTTTATVPPAPGSPAANYLTRIGRITLQGGNINFSDRFIKPNYSANLTGVGGGVTRISAEAPADLDLRGTVDNSAPLLIGGRINPLAKDLFLDIKGSVKGFDLSPMTPYSGRYIGYAIQKGKLSLDVAYKLDERKLTATNKLLLTQLTLGDKIDHPDATKLPVTLALALLKDRNGNIDLELPISGSLDDPQFSVGAIVVKVIVNLIVKAVTAPFALLGALFSGGGGEELSWVEFDYGYAGISAASGAKIANLVKALEDRPGLNLEVAGRVDPEQDKEGLRQAMLDQKVRTQKFRALARAGTPAASLADVKVEPAEYLQYLERAYEAEKFAKPRNVIGLAKSLPREEMEKLMLANTQVGDEDLRALADQRGKAVQQALLKAGISAERVFLLVPGIAAPEARDKAKLSRADLSLK